MPPGVVPEEPESVDPPVVVVVVLAVVLGVVVGGGVLVLAVLDVEVRAGDAVADACCVAPLPGTVTALEAPVAVELPRTVLVETTPDFGAGAETGDGDEHAASVAVRASSHGRVA